MRGDGKPHQIHHPNPPSTESVARERRICQRCLSGEVDDEHHMVFDCPALEEVRVQHAGLFAGSADLRSFLAQESSQVAAFVSAGFDAVLGD